MKTSNAKTTPVQLAAKAAQSAWNAIRTTNASAAEKNKVKEEYKRAAIKVIEERTGENLTRRPSKARAR